MQIVGERLRALREGLKMTQDELGALCADEMPAKDKEAMLNATVLRIFLVVEIALYAVFSVILFFLNSRLIDRKLNLT